MPRDASIWAAAWASVGLLARATFSRSARVSAASSARAGRSKPARASGTANQRQGFMPIPPVLLVLRVRSDLPQGLGESIRPSVRATRTRKAIHVGEVMRPRQSLRPAQLLLLHQPDAPAGDGGHPS